MAGPQDIQRYPRGLIDLLGMRATGDTPHTLAQSVSGTLEMLEFYLNDRLTPNASLALAPVTVVGDLTVTGLTVPPRELWLIWEVTMTSGTTAAATGFTASAGILRNRGSGNVYTALTDTQAVGALSQANVGRKWDRPIIALGTDVMNIRISSVTGAPAATPQISIFYAPIGV